MKKITLLLLLFINFIINAQDFDYLKSLKNFTTTEEVLNFTNEFINDCPDKFRLYGTKDFEEHSMFVVQYVPINLSDEEVKKTSDQDLGQFLIFQFRYLNDGENIALRIEGTKKYIFSDVRGHFLNLFPFWQKKVDPKADKIQLSKSGNSYIKGWSISGSNQNWKIKG